MPGVVESRGIYREADSDLAKLYSTSTSRLNEQVRRNRRRFPPDFMLELTSQEASSLTSQNAISKARGRGGRRHLPLAFTEQGVAMLSSVLKSDRAVEVNILVMRAFVKSRELLGAHAELAQKLDSLERKYDAQFKGGLRRDPRVDEPARAEEAPRRICKGMIDLPARERIALTRGYISTDALSLGDIAGASLNRVPGALASWRVRLAATLESSTRPAR